MILFILALKRRKLLQSESQTVMALRLLFLSALDMMNTTSNLSSSSSTTTTTTTEVENGKGKNVSKEKLKAQASIATEVITITPSSPPPPPPPTTTTITPIRAFTLLALALYKYSDLSNRPSILLCIMSSISYILTEEQKKGSTRAVMPAFEVLSQLQQAIFDPLLPLLLSQQQQQQQSSSSSTTTTTTTTTSTTTSTTSTSTIYAVIHAQITDLIRVFLHGLSLLLPTLLPSFSFAWASLLAYSPFLRLSTCIRDTQVATMQFKELLIIYTNYLMPLFGDSIQHHMKKHYSLYVGLLTSLLNLWPEMLSSHYGELCMRIPVRFLQLHNIICAAVPAGVTPPSMYSRIDDQIEKSLKTRTVDAWNTSTILSPAIREKIMQMPAKRNAMIPEIWSMMNRHDFMAVILYEVAAALYIRPCLESSSSSSSSSHTSVKPEFPLQFYQQIFFTQEYMFKRFCLESLLDHVRYPSFDTYTFCTLVKTFFGSDAETVFSVLCERLLVPGPKPWGLKFLFSQIVNSEGDTIQKLNCYSSNKEVRELCKQYCAPVTVQDGE